MSNRALSHEDLANITGGIMDGPSGCHTANVNVANNYYTLPAAPGPSHSGVESRR
jgi:hypothetical protein